MVPPADENLPEVVQPRPFEAEHNTSPQVASANDSAWTPSERDKYHVFYDPSPKLQVVDDHPVPKLEENNTLPKLEEALPAGAPAPENEIASERKICGLRRRIFYILAAIISIILLGAIIGGAVGGSLSNKSSSQSASQSGSDSAGSQESAPTTTSGSSSSSSTSSSSAATGTTTTTSSPTATRLPTLNNGTAPNNGLAFQGFSSPSYLGSATPIIQEEGFHDLNISARSYVWLPDSTECCLTFCANKTTATGWWCNTRYRPDPEASFARVYIWCGGNDGVKNETCS